MARDSSGDLWRPISETVALNAGLSLIFLVGDDMCVQEAFAQAAAALGDGWRTQTWRLDKQGPDLAAGPTGPKLALIVYGLERLSWHQRLDTIISLNLLRDTLRQRSGAGLFWIPRSILDEFLTRAPDLFHWRSLLIEVPNDTLNALEAAQADQQW